MRRRNKFQEREVAVERIRKLFGMAEEHASETQQLSDRYVRLARRIAMRYQVSIPRELRRRICRSCEGILIPGRTARVRIGSGRVAITCLRCETVKRYPLAVKRRTTT